MQSRLGGATSALLFMLAACPASAINEPDLNLLAPAQFKAAELQVSELGAPAETVSDGRFRDNARRIGGLESGAMVDLRTGRFVTLMPSTPLLPGSGAGNDLPKPVTQPSTLELQADAARVFTQWLVDHKSELQIDTAELADEPQITVISPDYIQIYQTRRVGGVLVRDSAIMASIKHGNLMLFGMSKWGDVDASRAASVTADAAVARLAAHIAPRQVGRLLKAAELEYVPVSTPAGGIGGAGAPGLSYRLAQVLRPSFNEPNSLYEVLVDAMSGEVLAITDTVDYVASPRAVTGGVFPVSNNGVGPGGMEQTGWPMPFTTVTTPTGTVTTDIGGTLPACVDGNISAGLTGTYVKINDTCGASSLTSAGNVDFGASAGTDCITPGFGGAGNTHAARSGYHELNMIKAMARGQLPNNLWLQGQLPATMNIAQTCNANWNGTSVNFYKSGGGCFNTGEIAGVFDHEWGHGMDGNGSVPGTSSPGEGIADIYASLRLNDSCIGPGFRSGQCSGEFGIAGACTSCTGVRDIDFAQHVGAMPVTLAMIDACPVGTSNGPCGGGVHCEGQVYSQAVWDLWNRDLIGAPYNLSKDVTREIATRLTFQGASGVSSWFACTDGTGGCGNPAGCGCAATSGYQQYLAADDDNGNLADGTPHMSAIFAAFDRHGIACSTPAVMDSGCANAPTQVPTVTATAGDGSVSLSWTASAGASQYRVYRTDGVFGCDFGKILLATVTGTEYVDVGVQNGREYSYSVMPTGSNSTCFSVSSVCTSATPQPGARLSVAGDLASFQTTTGDGDLFVDNCETTNVSLPISNIGVNAQNNVRVIAVSSPSHPATTILSPLPLTIVSNQASCTTNNAGINVVPQGLNAGDSFALDITIASDELLGQPTTVRVATNVTEGDLSASGTQLFSFDSDVQGWSVVRGTFAREAGASASGTTHHMHSSANLDAQCDTVESPVMILAADSTMSVFTNFDIEPMDTQWWDRANLAAFPVATGVPTLLTPTGGRAYNASGVGGACGMETDPGWGGVATTWAESTFNATGMQSAALANQLLTIRMRYGTDAAVSGTGMRFDQLSVTNARIRVADAQSNVCTAPPLFANGFEN